MAEKEKRMETEKKPDGWSRKIYLELTPPSPEDNASDQERILRALREEYGEAGCSLQVLQKLYPLCCQADWKITVLLVWNGKSWELADIEPGDTTGEHYGFCVDLGSTTLAGELIDMNRGAVRLYGHSRKHHHDPFPLWTGRFLRVFFSLCGAHPEAGLLQS